jgi:RluA family pseudouridine synthase
MFCTEFRDRQPQYYKAAIENGSIQINGQRSTIDYKIKNGDCVSHVMHRHEPPVSSRPVKVIHHDKERGLVVIDKPAGIPVHAAGRYHKNSLIAILKTENAFPFLAPINRLDRLTSGVMLLGLTSEFAAKMSEQFQERTMFKEYYCRVVGKFPDGETVLDKAIATVSPKHGLNRVRESGKSSKTIFQQVFYDEEKDQSVVLAKPLTGRTHQIRYKRGIKRC